MKSRLLLLITCLVMSAPTYAKGLIAKADRQQTQSFSATTLDGQQFNQDALKGQVTLITFWATWCGPCLQELPYFSKYYEKLSGKGVNIVAIATDGPETAAQVTSLVKQRGFKFPVVHDASGAIANTLNPRGNNPFGLLIDKSGKVAYRHEGYAPGDEKKYLKGILSLLKEK